MDTIDERSGISVLELAKWRQAEIAHVVLDVREAHELEICGLEGAMHIAMSQITERIDEVPRDKPVVVMCHHGSRSMMVVEFLRSAGVHNVVNLDGGIHAWACEVDNSIRLY